MTSKNPHVLLVAAAALVMFASSSVAQVGASSTHGTVQARPRQVAQGGLRAWERCRKISSG